MTQQEIPLHGGNTSTVVRVGDTVRRNAGPWTPAVHALLRHLEYVGFTGAPRAFGIDERGREVLSYLEGECGEYPLARHWVTEEALVTVATMLRMFHDAQYGFRAPPNAVWRSFGPPPPDTEVICHHDAAPHNVIWRPDGTLALIDFDLASPGARIYDVAYAAWTWVPLFSDRDSYTLWWKRPNRPHRNRGRPRPNPTRRSDSNSRSRRLLRTRSDQTSCRRRTTHSRCRRSTWSRRSAP